MSDDEGNLGISLVERSDKFAEHESFGDEDERVSSQSVDDTCCTARDEL